MMRISFVLLTLLGAVACVTPLQADQKKAPPVPANEKKAPPIPEGPQLKISGQTSFNSWFFNNHQKTQSTGLLNGASTVPPGVNNPSKVDTYGKGQLFTMDSSRLRFTVDTKMDCGTTYGLVFVLDGNVSAGKTVREDYIFGEGHWGKVFAGDTYGVQSTMAFGGYDQWGGTEFVDGDMSRAVNYTTGALVSPDLVGDTGRATKLTYQTPRWKGFQVGVSYTPRTEHKGEQTVSSTTSLDSTKKPFNTDNIASGINFIHKFCNGLEAALSATSVFGQAHPEYVTMPPRKNVASFALGGTFTYADIGVSAEYGNNGKSLEFTGQNISNAGQFLDFGLGYTWKATKFSAGYYYGWRNALGGGTTSGFTRAKSKTNAVSAAVDHKLVPGMIVYFEYANFQMKNPAATDEANRLNSLFNTTSGGQYTGPVPSNRANAFVVGSRLVF